MIELYFLILLFSIVMFLLIRMMFIETQIDNYIYKDIIVYQKDYSVITIPIIATLICSIILIGCFVLSDVVTIPIQMSLGATQNQIREYSNIFLLKNHYKEFLIFIFLIYIISFLMFKYLQHGFESGIFTIPYHKTIKTIKIKKSEYNRTKINQLVNSL